MNLILASASPRRKELLDLTSQPYTVEVAHVEELESSPGTPADLAVANAALKARAVFERHPDALVLGADTIVVQEHGILGKPQDEADAKRMLRSLSGRSHEVITGVAFIGSGINERWSVSTQVEFRDLAEAEIDAYVATGEPMDKAGAYGIQGRAASFVSRIDGSYTNVVGLPLAEVIQQIHRLS